MVKSFSILLCIFDVLELLQSNNSGNTSNYLSPEIINYKAQKKKKSFLLQMLIMVMNILSIVIVNYIV